jgi:hypothetical protein
MLCFMELNLLFPVALLRCATKEAAIPSDLTSTPHTFTCRLPGCDPFYENTCRIFIFLKVRTSDCGVFAVPPEYVGYWKILGHASKCWSEIHTVVMVGIL